MRFRTVMEATSFVRALAEAKSAGKRELLGAKLDSVPAWESPDGKLVEHKLDGSEIEVVYLSYLPATDTQKRQATPAKLAGVKLERIAGRLVDVRKCKDGTVQVLFTNGLRDGEGKVAFRGPNVDKGILCYLAVGEGLGEPVDDIIARVPQDAIDRLRDGKMGKTTKAKKAKAEDPNQPVMITVPAIEATKAKPEEPGENRVKLK
jgi:hypothetical protein